MGAQLLLLYSNLGCPATVFIHFSNTIHLNVLIFTVTVQINVIVICSSCILNLTGDFVKLKINSFSLSYFSFIYFVVLVPRR